MNNKSIQILRSNSNYDTTTSTEVLLDGQPYISKKLQKLMFGDGTQTLSEKCSTESGIDLHPNLENSEGQYSLRMPYYGENTDNLYFPSRAEPVLDEDGKEYISFGVALGLSNILRGQYSLVTGRLNVDEAANNITGGLSNEVYQSHNLTSGQENKNYGKRSLVVGYQNILGNTDISPEGNIVAGQLNKNITGHFNIVSGESHKNIDGNNNIVFGQGNTVTANHNFVGGYDNTVTNQRCLVLGYENEVSKAGNFVFGHNIRAAGTEYQTLIGNNFSADDKSLFIVGEDKPLFYVQKDFSRFANELVVANDIRTSNSSFKVNLTGINTIETTKNIKCGGSLSLPQISLSTSNANDYDHLYVSGVNTTNTQLHVKSVYTDTLYSDSLLLRSEQTLSQGNMYAATVGQLYEEQQARSQSDDDFRSQIDNIHITVNGNKYYLVEEDLKLRTHLSEYLSFTLAQGSFFNFGGAVYTIRVGGSFTNLYSGNYFMLSLTNNNTNQIGYAYLQLVNFTDSKINVFVKSVYMPDSGMTEYNRLTSFTPDGTDIGSNIIANKLSSISLNTIKYLFLPDN